MKIAIIGTGGVGGYFGGKLAQAGHEVHFLARGAHLEAIQQNGLTVKSFMGDFHVANVHATDRLQDIGLVDLVIVSLKAWQLKEQREAIKNLIHAQTLVLPLQNGVLAADELAEAIPAEHILGGLCRIISKIESPGVIAHIGVKPTIVFGEFNQQVSERSQMLKTVFDSAGFESRIADDIEAELWKKFISICVSGLMAVSRTNYGQMRSLPPLRQMMIDLLNEIYAVSQAKGVRIEADFVAKTVAYLDNLPYESNSSLTRDVMQGKRSEIEYQNGTVVRLGEQYGVATPVNKFVYQCILPTELKAQNLL